jgi:hypothetical protein
MVILLQDRTYPVRRRVPRRTLSGREPPLSLVLHPGPGFFIIGHQSGSQQDSAYLLDLIGLCLAAPRLEIQDLRHIVPGKDVVAASDPLLEAEMLQQSAQVIEIDISV